jgi:porphobilinogen deaminase
MKLAEALLARAGCQHRMDDLEERMARNATVQEGAEPAEDAAALLAEYERTAEELLHLIRAINHTNAVARLDAERTLTDALAERDVLRIRVAQYRHLAQAATVELSRYSRSELICRSAVNVRDIQRRADVIAKQGRELDARIQRLNWEVDLVQ